MSGNDDEVTVISRMPLVGATAARFVAIGSTVMRGDEHIGVMRSHTMAKRTANALNAHVPNKEGV